MTMAGTGIPPEGETPERQEESRARGPGHHEIQSAIHNDEARGVRNPMENELNLIEMELREIQMKDDAIGSQIIVLGEKNGTREFPIFIGYAEALALDLALHGYKNIRPMTHDLIYNIIDGLGAEMSHVVVDDLRQDTFFGKLVVKTVQGTQEVIDSRPSDAIVLATKRQLPIFVAEHVLDQVLRHQEEEEDE
jgi:bifunctional DNase/RNase